MVEYFNRYAYIEIALYGKSYITAAKDTWRLLKDRGTSSLLSSLFQQWAKAGDVFKALTRELWSIGIDALVNDSLVSMTLTWGAYVVGISCSLFGYLYLKCACVSLFLLSVGPRTDCASLVHCCDIDTHPSYNDDGSYTPVVLFFAFIIGIQCCEV